MQNRFFTEAQLDSLLHPERWQVISSLMAPEVEAIDHPHHQAWMVEHSHEHAHREILFIISGQGQLGYLGRVYPYRPGTIFLFDSFEPHDLNCPDSFTGMEHLWLIVMRDHFVARLLSIRRGEYLWPGEWNYLLSHREAELHAENDLFRLRDDAGFPAEYLRMRIYAVISMLITALIRAGYTEPVYEDRDSFQSRIVATIQQHIQETAGNGVSLESLARISGYSKFHFLRLFREHTGQTVHEYIDYCRLQRVRKLLESGYSKKAVSAALGFSCQSAFSRWYKRWQAYE